MKISVAQHFTKRCRLYELLTVTSPLPIAKQKYCVQGFQIILQRLLESVFAWPFLVTIVIT